MSLEEAIEFIDSHPSNSPLAVAARVILVHYQHLQQHLESSGRIIDSLSESLSDALED